MPAPARECQLCGRPAPLACSGCGALFYCSQAHLRRHANQLGHDADECRRWAAAAAPERRQELVGHSGLPWAAATHSLPPCTYLSQLGLHCSSGGGAASPTAWLRECACGGPAAAPWGAAAPLHNLWTCGSTPSAGPPEGVVSRADLVQRLGGWLGLPLAHAPCLLSAAPPTSAPLASWAAYYRLRGLPPESPAALLLDATLTLYSAVVRLHRQLAALQHANGGADRQHAGSSGGSASAPSAANGSCRAAGASGCELPLQPLPLLLSGGRLVLHLLGPQRELDQWPLLLELGCLLPRQLHIDLHLIGPDVPAAAHRRTVHVSAPAAGPCGREGCSCAVAWRGERECAAGTAAQQADQQQAAGAASDEQQQAAGAAIDEQQQGAGGMRLWFWRGAYHEVAPELALQHGLPHAVVAPNAGLAAYMTWLPTLQLLLGQLQGSSSGGGGGSGGVHCSADGQPYASRQAAERGPLVCCFTDYNSEAVHRSRQLMDYLLPSQGAACGGSGGAGSGVQPGGGRATGSLVVQDGLHPFRKPAAVLATDNALPSASNGFALWLARCVAC